MAELFTIGHKLKNAALAFVVVPFLVNAGLVIFIMNRELRQEKVFFFVFLFV